LGGRVPLRARVSAVNTLLRSGAALNAESLLEAAVRCLVRASVTVRVIVT
jgi:hypothetical protein